MNTEAILDDDAPINQYQKYRREAVESLES